VVLPSLLVFACSVQEASEEESDTPLKRKLDEFGEMLAKVIMYICIAGGHQRAQQLANPVWISIMATWRVCGGLTDAWLHTLPCSVAYQLQALPQLEAPPRLLGAQPLHHRVLGRQGHLLLQGGPRAGAASCGCVIERCKA
jgi:hypothetical protein